MQAFIIIEIIFIFFLTVYLLHHYASPRVPIFVKAIIFCPWFLCFFTIGLTPIDIYYSYTSDGNTIDNGPGSASQNLENTWRAIYWTSFFLSWLGLPLLRGYVTAGDFTPKDRLKRAALGSLKFYLVMAVLGVLFLLYLLASGKMGTEGVVQFLVTLSSCFGIFLIVLCLGFGLVAVPKRYIQRTKKQINLKYYQFHLGEVREEKMSLQLKLEQLVQKIYALTLRKDVDSFQRDLLNTVLIRCSDDLITKAKKYVNALTEKRKMEITQDYGVVTNENIVTLNREMKAACKELLRLENKYKTTLEDALFAEDVLECNTAEVWAQRTKPELPPPTQGWPKYKNWIQWAWYTKLEQICLFILGVIFALISAALFILEILTFLKLNLFNIDKWIGNNFAGGQIACLIPLCYLAFCVYTSLFGMKLSSVYGLYPHHTDSGSLVFASTNFSRCTAPLVFNFLQMNQLSQTNYNTIMGNASLAYSFTDYFPILLIVLVLGQAFDVYGRVMNKVGLSRFRFSEDFNDERIEDGKFILAKARKEKTTGLKERGISQIVKVPKETPAVTLNAKLLGRTSTDTSFASDDNRSRMNTIDDNRSRINTIDSPDKLLMKPTGKSDTFSLELGKL